MHRGGVHYNQRYNSRDTREKDKGEKQYSYTSFITELYGIQSYSDKCTLYQLLFNTYIKQEIINCTFVGIRLYTIKMYGENIIKELYGVLLN